LNAGSRFFEPFAHGSENPTLEVLAQLQRANDIEGDLTTIQLPVDSERISAITSENLDTLRPDLWISLGLAPGLAVIAVERIAANVMDFPIPDNVGVQPCRSRPSRRICAPKPTTALDVTVQAKILRLLHNLQEEMRASLLLITHDLGVVASMADEVLVMYAGRIVERADVDTLFHHARHPYTKALLGCVAGIEDDRSVPLEPIAGAAPDLRNPPRGCRFAPRCSMSRDICWVQDQPLVSVSQDHAVACILAQAEAAHV
jgi:oligopeptide/dipeptide ABC transporter ATP-binding protein